jgi:hypothetical protein
MVRLSRLPARTKIDAIFVPSRPRRSRTGISTVLSGVAKFERELICIRTGEGGARAKEDGISPIMRGRDGAAGT